MTNKEFQHLLDMAISRGGLNMVGLDKVYVMLTWWDDEFLPLTDLDGNWRTGEKICIFGSRECPCNKWHNGLPCAFWIAKELGEEALPMAETWVFEWIVANDNQERKEK